jgi:hypothetical protein
MVSCQPTVRWLPMLPQFDLQTKYQLTPHFLVGHVECGSDGVRLNEHECLADRSTQLWWVGVGHNFSVYAWDHAVIMECQSQTKRHESRGQCNAPMTGLAKGASRTMQHACEATRDSKGAPLQPCHHVARHCDRQKGKNCPKPLLNSCFLTIALERTTSLTPLVVSLPVHFSCMRLHHKHSQHLCAPFSTAVLAQEVHHTAPSLPSHTLGSVERFV